jgi:hypothetical protein
VTGLATACAGEGTSRLMPPAPANLRDGLASGSAVGFAEGRVVDDATGRPIAGALVVISPVAYSSHSLPLGANADVPHAVSDARGRFVVLELLKSQWPVWSWKYIGSRLSVRNPQWVEIFPRGGDPHVSYHGFRTIDDRRSNHLSTIALTVPTPDEAAWKRRVEDDRAHEGSPPVTIPLVFDEITLEAGRRWAAYMAANNWYAHTCPPPGPYAPCIDTWNWEAMHHGMPSAENVDINVSWEGAESAFMQERFNCPHLSWRRCVWAENTGHYINIMSSKNWIGLGIAVGSNGSEWKALGPDGCGYVAQ